MEKRPRGFQIRMALLLDWTHPADGRPSGSSLQAVEQDGNSSETTGLKSNK
jgi:hypothetical protein